MKKIAILICDTPADDIRAKFGDYFQLFSELLEGKDFSFTKYDVTNEEYPKRANDFDAYLLTGSSKHHFI